jgi:hypothetical protein
LERRRHVTVAKAESILFWRRTAGAANHDREIGQHELWTVDLARKRLESRVEFKGRRRLALRASSNGKLIYLYEAGNTIDLYDAAGFKYLRTITLDEDMMYGTFHVVPPRPRAGTALQP